MHHPVKCKRPIASGELAVGTAITGALSLILAALTAIFFFNTLFFIIALIYIGINIFYSSVLKKIVILDVMVIAIGFVLRLEIGGAVNDISLSVWILLITFLLAIFLGLIKRRQELVKLLEKKGWGERKSDDNVRKTLKEYNVALLDQLISITTATTLISYIVYVTHADTLEKFKTKNLYLTVPFLIFGLFRYLYLTYSKGKGENPAEVIFSDISFSINMVLWVAVFIIIVLT